MRHTVARNGPGRVRSTAVGLALVLLMVMVAPPAEAHAPPDPPQPPSVTGTLDTVNRTLEDPPSRDDVVGFVDDVYGAAVRFAMAATEETREDVWQTVRDEAGSSFTCERPHVGYPVDRPLLPFEVCYGTDHGDCAVIVKALTFLCLGDE